MDLCSISLVLSSLPVANLLPLLSAKQQRPLCETRSRLVERLDRPIGGGEHQTALERGHYVKGSRFRSGAADPLR